MERENFGGSEETVTTYTYTKKWSTDEISSSNFHESAGHENPGAFPYAQDTQYANDAALGDFSLRPSTIEKIGGKAAVPVAGF